MGTENLGTFAAFRYPNYRLWFLGQLTSMFGSWMQFTAQGYLLYELTHSTLALGYVSIASGLPAMLLMLYGGVVADRANRRYLMISVQLLSMLQASIMTVLTFMHIIQPWHIIALAVLSGIGNAFDAPARHSFVPEMVGNKYISNATALNSMTFHLASTVGPGLGGIIYYFKGPGWCFLLNALSFLAVILALALMKLKKLPKKSPQSARKDFWQGVHYLRSQKIILSIALLQAVTVFFGLSYVTLVPAWAVSILGGNASTNGWLQSTRGVGAVLASLIIASVSHRPIKGKLLSIGALLTPILLFIFSYTNSLTASLFALLLIGMSTLCVFNLSIALTQMRVVDEFRGRVLAFMNLIFFGGISLSGLCSGMVADWLGLPLTLRLAAILCLGCAVLVLRKAPELLELE